GWNPNRANVTGVLDGNWHNLIFTYESGTVRSYFDGALFATATYTHNAGLSNSQPLQIGGQTSRNGLIGQMDDVGIFNNTLSLGEAVSIYKLATESRFGYDLEDVNELFEVFEAGAGSVNVNGDTWQYQTNVGGAEGDLFQSGGAWYLNLDGVNGLMIPEPSGLACVTLAFAALGLRRRRKG
ncbi:MAG: LamG-like jellyroll fold domain-containing protein, partial [Verrucomicrobiales bacterium]